MFKSIEIIMKESTIIDAMNNSRKEFVEVNVHIRRMRVLIRALCAVNILIILVLFMII